MSTRNKSISRQVDKKSGFPEEERGAGILKKEERTNYFFSTFLSLSHIKHFLFFVFFFPLSQELMITQQTTQFKFCGLVSGLAIKSCQTLCNFMDYSLPGSSVHGLLQARILEWVAISFSRGSFQPRNRTWVSCIAGRFFTNWARDYITTMYPAWGQFLLPENLLTNPYILEYILWDWVW